jgi:hypothetical protein
LDRHVDLTVSGHLDQFTVGRLTDMHRQVRLSALQDLKHRDKHVLYEIARCRDSKLCHAGWRPDRLQFRGEFIEDSDCPLAESKEHPAYRGRRDSYTGMPIKDRRAEGPLNVPDTLGDGRLREAQHLACLLEGTCAYDGPYRVKLVEGQAIHEKLRFRK